MPDVRPSINRLESIMTRALSRNRERTAGFSGRVGFGIFGGMMGARRGWPGLAEIFQMATNGRNLKPDHPAVGEMHGDGIVRGGNRQQIEDLILAAHIDVADLYRADLVEANAAVHPLVGRFFGKTGILDLRSLVAAVASAGRQARLVPEADPLSVSQRKRFATRIKRFSPFR